LAQINHYPVGQGVTVKGTFTNTASGATVDPTDAIVDVLDPTGVTNTYHYVGGAVVKVSAGVYTYSIDTTAKAGRWQYRWYSPGGTTVAAAGFGEFIVDAWPQATP
jgi:hypothetical protein